MHAHTQLHAHACAFWCKLCKLSMHAHTHTHNCVHVCKWWWAHQAHVFRWQRTWSREAATVGSISGQDMVRQFFQVKNCADLLVPVSPSCAQHPLTLLHTLKMPWLPFNKRRPKQVNGVFFLSFVLYFSLTCSNIHQAEWQQQLDFMIWRLKHCMPLK